MTTALFGVAAACLAAVQSPRPSSVPDDPPAPEPVEVRIELSGPRGGTHVWAASEWTVSFENQGLDDFPFDEAILEPGGWGGGLVGFEIATDGKVVRLMSSRGYLHSSRCGGIDKTKVLKPGASARLQMVLHGEMINPVFVPGYPQEVDVGERFVPAFDEPGTYTVTAILCVQGARVRSQPVTIEVAAPPAGSARAVEGLEELAKTGICLHVQGMHTTSPWAQLERISEFVDRERGTLYGAQMQLALARALFRIGQSRIRYESEVAKPRPLGIDATLGRVKSLVPVDLPLGFGLENSLARLRTEIAAASVEPPPIEDDR